MSLDYPDIILSTKTPIHMTHDVRYMTHYEGLPSSRSAVKITAMQFAVENPSPDHVEQILREQLGIDDGATVTIISVGQFTGYATRA